MKDRLPPHDQNAEKCIIGCCVQSPKECLAEAQMVITSSSFFYEVRCQAVWEAMTQTEIDKIDTISLSAQFPIAFLNECIELVPSTANLSVWLEIVAEKYTIRLTIAVCTKLITEAYNTKDSLELLDKAERFILAIRPNQADASDIKSLVHEALNKIEQRCKSQAMTGFTTGLMDLDRLTDGIHAGEMIVLAAYPSCGKTALAVNVAVTNALLKIPAAIFSAEMRPVQLVIRSICAESRINFHKVTFDDAPKMTSAAVRLSNAPLYLEQANRLSIGQIIAKARRLKQKHGIKMAVVDYIQLLTGHGDNREQEISSISKGIKSMALELDIPVIALSQLTDDGKLRESRAIGQDADSVWKLANDGEWQHEIQPVKLTVEKCRDGATGVVDLTFMKHFTRFENAAH